MDKGAVTFDVRTAHEGGMEPGPGPTKQLAIDTVKFHEPRSDMPPIAWSPYSRRAPPSSRTGTVEVARLVSCSVQPRYC
jgi:hypothetical protein